MNLVVQGDAIPAEPPSDGRGSARDGLDNLADLGADSHCLSVLGRYCFGAERPAYSWLVRTCPPWGAILRRVFIPAQCPIASLPAKGWSVSVLTMPGGERGRVVKSHHSATVLREQ